MGVPRNQRCVSIFDGLSRLVSSDVNGYVRPVVVEQTFRDSDGSVIDYGDRWDGEGPPSDSYSVDTHPERFAPLHTVAEALLEYLQSEYEVEVADDLSCADDLWRPGPSALRAVRITPAADNAAAMTFVFTDYPGIVVHAGLVHDFTYPICGCDACDETWDSVADDLEETVQAVASGQYREDIRRHYGSHWIWSQLTGPSGSSQGSGGSISVDDPALLRAASALLKALPNGSWEPWPRR
jgi:hypothetical protein